MELLNSEPALFTGLVFLFGLLVGSFLNVVIHRLPKMMEAEWKAQCAELRGETLPDTPCSERRKRYNLWLPRSACTQCGHQITALENIPLLSWLWLRGRCSACGTPISARYPLVELLTALLSAAVAWKWGASMQTLAALLLVWALVALAFIDLDTTLLPDSLTLPLLWLGLLFNLNGYFSSLPDAVIGTMAGYGVLWSVYWLFRLATGKEGMGFGDFKLLAALGAWTGWQTIPLILLVSATSGAAIGILAIWLSGKGRDTRIPFGPYLAAGGMVALLWGREAVIAYLGRFPA